MDFVVGAYPAAPADPALASELFTAVLSTPRVGGLELPFLGNGSTVEDDAWVAALPPGGRHVITAVPATAMAARNDSAFGLASPDADGRRRAVELAAGVRDAVARIHDADAGTVVAVEFQTAPGGGAGRPAGTADRLAESLGELLRWDWGGARLVVEHCDAAVGPHEPEKGFLPLPDEIEAIRTADPGGEAGLGLAINWARSVIEGRDPRTAAEHVREAAAAGLLAGVVFSGVAATGHPSGDWADAHLPPRPYEPASLLDEDAMAETLAAAGDSLSALAFAGVKLVARRGDDTVQQRAEGLRLAVEMLDRAWPQQ